MHTLQLLLSSTVSAASAAFYCTCHAKITQYAPINSQCYIACKDGYMEIATGTTLTINDQLKQRTEQHNTTKCHVSRGQRQNLLAGFCTGNQ